MTAELEALPLMRKLKAVQAVIAAYEGHAEPAKRSLLVPQHGITGVGRAQHAFGVSTFTASSRRESSADTIRAAAADYLREKGARAETPEIVTAIEGRGVCIPSSNKIGVVSSYLSSAKGIFDNQRGQGYGLKEWSEAQSADSVRGAEAPANFLAGVANAEPEKEAADPQEGPAD
ncbi:hypothetical protein [Roseicella aerolata]|uniref:Uncharacterized protein n=1 Tax=Roseicella aerolata TaxID=2883479 RepID=A0A9X1IDG3_9PROT|nr:hypothetical protein [Roseicella aerolata]MCB4822694.1 hypothetical protein [Roseicella aerolata]